MSVASKSKFEFYIAFVSRIDTFTVQPTKIVDRPGVGTRSESDDARPILQLVSQLPST